MSPQATLSPQEAMAQAGRDYPQAWEQMRMMIRDRGRPPLPDWPGWCLLPMAGWYSVISAQAGVDRLPVAAMNDVSRLAALGAWRLTQGVYRFAPELLAALAQTTMDGDLPADVLLWLPEWCVYIEMPYEGGGGFWAHAEHDAASGRRELRLLYNCNGAIFPMLIHLGDWPLREALERADMEARRQAEIAGIGKRLTTPEDLAAGRELLAVPINLLLYLCSEDPEIDPQRVPDRRPQRRLSARYKRGGWQIPGGVTVWEIGREIGAQLREGNRGVTVEGRISPRPHIRRAHWHGFWRGTGEERKFFHKWLPPLFVGGEQ